MDIKKRILSKIKANSFATSLIVSFFIFMIIDCTLIVYNQTLGEKSSITLTCISFALPVLIGIAGYNSKRLQRYHLLKWRKKISADYSYAKKWREKFFSDVVTNKINSDIEEKKKFISSLELIIQELDQLRENAISSSVWQKYPHHSAVEKYLSSLKELLSQAKSLSNEEIVDDALDHWNDLNFNDLKFQKKLDRYQARIKIFDELIGL